MLTTTILATTQQEPDEGFGKLIGMLAAFAIFWAATEIHSRIMARRADPSPPPPASGVKKPRPQVKRGVTRSDTRVDTYDWGAIGHEDTDPTPPETAPDTGRRPRGQRFDTAPDGRRLTRAQQIVNVWRHGDRWGPKPKPKPPAEEERWDYEDEPGQEQETQFVAYQPGAPVADDAVIDLDLEDDSETLEEYVDRRDREPDRKGKHASIKRDTMDRFSISESKFDRILREVRAARNEESQ